MLGMKYHIQNKVSSKWLENFKWESDKWILTWSDDRATARLLDRTEITMLKVELKDCSGFRGEWADKLAPDGVVAFGRRKVRKGGVVSFAGGKFRHDKLLEFVGKNIFIEADGYWIVSPHAFKTHHSWIEKDNHICDLEEVK